MIELLSYLGLGLLALAVAPIVSRACFLTAMWVRDQFRGPPKPFMNRDIRRPASIARRASTPGARREPSLGGRAKAAVGAQGASRRTTSSAKASSSRFEPTAAGEGVRLVSAGGRKQAAARRPESPRADARPDAKRASKAAPRLASSARATPEEPRRVAAEALRSKLPGGRLIGDRDVEPQLEAGGRVEPEMSAGAPVVRLVDPDARGVEPEIGPAGASAAAASVGGADFGDLVFDAGEAPEFRTGAEGETEGDEGRRGGGSLWRRGDRRSAPRSDALADRLAEARRTLAQEQQAEQETQAEEAERSEALADAAHEVEEQRQAEMLRLREEEAGRARAEAERVREARAKKALELERRNKIMQATDAIMARAKAQGRPIEPKEAFMMARRQLAQSLRDEPTSASSGQAEVKDLKTG